MNWNHDKITERAAAAHNPLPVNRDRPAAQYGGRSFNPVNWDCRVLAPENWPDQPILSSPQVIIQEFSAGRFLNGLALVVSWGAMWRQNNRIYGNRSLRVIHDALTFCALSLRETKSIDESWERLTGNAQNQLMWSPVITSKTLHFLSRSVGIEQDPPVAIDNAIILQRVWPIWIEMIPVHHRPQVWRGNTLDSYLRYMTAINIWANQRGWTTTEIETTIFSVYKNRG